MGRLTEVEIFDCLRDNFRSAAQACDDLAKLPRKGPSFLRLRESLKLIEGAARQASVWRQDTRWLQVGLYAAEAHKRAGNWLRGYKTRDGVRITHNEGTLHPLFTKLAANLRAGLARAEEYRTKATGKVGMILPNVRPGPHRDTRPVGYERKSSGLLVPAGAS